MLLYPSLFLLMNISPSLYLPLSPSLSFSRLLSPPLSSSLPLSPTLSPSLSLYPPLSPSLFHSLPHSHIFSINREEEGELHEGVELVELYEEVGNKREVVPALQTVRNKSASKGNCQFNGGMLPFTNKQKN